MQPSGESNRLEIAEAFGISDIELSDAVDSVMEYLPTKNELYIDPIILKAYIRPILYSRGAPMIGGDRDF